MSEFQDLFGEEFFVLDSNNLNSIQTKLYGYVLIKDGDDYKIIQDNLNNPSNLTPDGTYVYIYKNDENIFVYQDFNGCYGLYYYENEGYFCISNSFIKLVNYLKHKKPLSLNYEVAASYLSSTLCTLSYKQTLINEINLIPRNKYIKIDINSKKINIISIDYQENTVDLDSKEAFDILDKWFYKWINIFRQIKSKTNNLTFDLTGGYDSRINFALLLSSGIDLNTIMIRSIDNNLHTHGEDFAIASQIAEHYGFKINNRKNINNNPQYFKDISTTLNISFYTKLCFHNQMYYKIARNENSNYRVTGSGGGMLRGYEAPADDFYTKRSEIISGDLTKSTQKVFDLNLKEYIKEFNISEDEFAYINYKETRRTNHFGKQNVESYLVNDILLNPLIDSDIAKLKRSTEEWPDDNLLMTLIFVRYSPSLLEFKFQDGKGIDINTIEYTKFFNEKYPFKKKNFGKIGFSVEKVNDCEKSKVHFFHKDINDYLKGIFLTKSFRNTFQTHFSPKIYDWVASKVEKQKYFPLQYTYPLFSIIKMINDVDISKKNYDNNELGWLEKFNDIPNYVDIDLKAKNLLLKYVTARIDIINRGENNSIELIECSDLTANVKEPAWISQSKGGGLVFTSDKSYIKIKIKTINKGQMVISLRSRLIKDKNKNKFPIYIDYTNLIINDNVIFDENILVWHDKPFKFKQDVEDGEVMTIHIEWLPFNQNSDFIFK